MEHLTKIYQALSNYISKPENLQESNPSLKFFAKDQFNLIIVQPKEQMIRECLNLEPGNLSIIYRHKDQSLLFIRGTELDLFNLYLEYKELLTVRKMLQLGQANQ